MLGKLHRRQLVLSAALLVTLIAAYFAPPEQTEELVEANKRSSATTANVSNPIEQPIKQGSDGFIKKRLWVMEKSQNLFPSKIRPLPVVPLQQVQLPPPKPTAPPLPFVYVGKVIEEGKPTIFVSKQQKNFLLKGGEVIEGTYKVEKVESGRVVFIYLPLETEQEMIIGG